MDNHTEKFKIRLGLFVAGGLALFVIAIFIIGKQKNVFDSVFNLTTTFGNVNGLQVGNNIRFAGINVGTVDEITIVNDSTVRVDMIVKKKVQKFIRTDCRAGIGSEGIIGDRVLNITQGSIDAPIVKDGQYILSSEPIETDAVMAKLKVTVDNTAIVALQLAAITTKINSGKGILWKLIQDPTLAENISQTIVSLKTSSKKLDENMVAVRDNFFLRGFFKKKEKAAQEIKDNAAEKKEEEKKSQEKDDNDTN